MKYLKVFELNKDVESDFSHTKEDIENFYIDLIDEHIFKYDEEYDGFNRNAKYDFVKLYFKNYNFISEDTYLKLGDDHKLKTINDHNFRCYYVQLKLIGHKRGRLFQTPPAPNMNYGNMVYMNDVEDSIEVLHHIKSIKGRAEDDNLKFYYNFNGITLRMFFIETSNQLPQPNHPPK